MCYPDSVVLAAGDDPSGGRSQHRDRLLVSALYRARELAADHVLAAVTGGGRHAASPGSTWRETTRSFHQKCSATFISLYCFIFVLVEDHVKQQIYTFANLKKEHVWMFYLRNDKLYSCQLMNQLIVEAPVYILFHFMMKKAPNQAVGLNEWRFWASPLYCSRHRGLFISTVKKSRDPLSRAATILRRKRENTDDEVKSCKDKVRLVFL